jgi:hypothetical protein
MERGSKSDGVPPPKKIVLTRSPAHGESCARRVISVISARVYSASGHVEAAWELKSQYGHFDWHHGIWM